jgi:hypothetical protein
MPSGIRGGRENNIYSAFSLIINSSIEGNSAIHFLDNDSSLPSFKRFFFITSDGQTERGNHAHKYATQAFIVVKGEVSLFVKDGVNEKMYNLKPGDECIVLPPGLWSQQTFVKNSILFVLTDTEYSEEEYIRDWEDYLKFKGVI